MNTKLQILTIFLMIHASVYSMVIQPELSNKSKDILIQYDKALNNYKDALVKYKNLDPSIRDKTRFDFYKFDFVVDNVVQNIRIL